MTHYSIGEFAKKTGLPISTLRYLRTRKNLFTLIEEKK